MTCPERDRRDHRAADFGQVEQPDVNRAVAPGQDAGGERGRRHRRRRREQRHDDPGDRDRAGEHRADRQQRPLGAVLVDDQGDDRRQAAQQRHDRLGVQEAWLVSSEAPKKAATQPTAASPIAGRSRGESGLAGGASSKVNTSQHERHGRDRGDDPEQRSPGVRLRLQAADERAERDRAEDAHVHDHRRVAELVRRIADRQRRNGGDQQQAGAQALDHVADDEHLRVLRGCRQHRPDDEQHRVADQHPALRQVLGELNRQHRAHRVGGVAQARAEAHRLQAHVELLGDDRRQRAERSRQRQIRDQREHDHGRDCGVPAGEWARSISPLSPAGEY